MKKIGFCLLIALVSAGLLFGQVLTLDQTGVDDFHRSYGSGFYSGPLLEQMKNAPAGAHILVTMSGTTDNTSAAIVGAGNNMDKPILEVFIGSSKIGTYQARVLVSNLFNTPEAKAAKWLIVKAWGHNIQKVEYIVPANYTPPAEFSVFNSASGLARRVNIKGGKVTSSGIIVNANKSGTPRFELEFNFSSALDITKFEKILVEWDGVHPRVNGLGMYVYFHDSQGRYSIMSPGFFSKNNSGGILGENMAEWDSSMTAWNTLNKKSIKKIIFTCWDYWANDNWDSQKKINDPETIDLIIKSIKFVEAEKF